MDKPISLSVKDYLIRKMAVKLMIKEEVILSVVNHQFTAAIQAMSTNKSVEISGFGKFYFNYNKAVKKMDKMLLQREHLYKQLSHPDSSENKKRVAQMKIDSLTEAIESLKPMLENNEAVTDLRGVEEQVGSASQAQGTDN